MDDEELRAIRAARLEQLRQKSQNAAPTQQGIPVPGADEPDLAARRAAEEQMRLDMLAAVLDPAARERLARIALVSPERSNQIETILIRMVQSNQLKGRIGEEQLIEILTQVEEAQSKSGTKKGAIVYHRRKETEDDFDI